MIVCNRCGKENQDHYKFCLGCGAELTAPAKPGGDIAVMKTMMADASTLGPGGPGGRPGGATPSPFGSPMPGPGPGPGPMPGPMPGPGPMGGMPGPMPGPGPMSGAMPGQQPMGPPPGVPGGGFGAAPVASGPKRCPQCGTDVPPNFRFCGACGHRMDDASAPVSAPVAVPPSAPMVAPNPTLTLIRPDGSEGGTVELQHGDNTIGRSQGAMFENDGYLSPTHAELSVHDGKANVRDLDSLNGVFVKITEEEEIQPGQVFRIGQELLRFDLVTPPEPMPDGTEVMGSPNPGYWGKVTVIIGKEVDGSAFPLLGEIVTLGRERGEINFPDDGYVSGLHAKLSTREGRVFLADMGSSNGTFLKIAGERAIGNDSFVLLGQQLFRLNY
ncbi:MAG: FHA domain-containing protein [Kofleriaceae bacterium]|nr:FHA domain-containing protein [Kofleriaceae bacterium]